MILSAKSKKRYRITTLKRLIQRLFKKYKLNPTVHFDVWICGYCQNEKDDIIDKDNPWACCHFNGYKKTKVDATDVFQWLEFEVEDFEFVITEKPEYWLYVKLLDINANFNRF